MPDKSLRSLVLQCHFAGPDICVGNTLVCVCACVFQQSDKKNGFVNVGELEGCVHFKIGEIPCTCRLLVIASVWAYMFVCVFVCLFDLTSVHPKVILDICVCVCVCVCIRYRRPHFSTKLHQS